MSKSIRKVYDGQLSMPFDGMGLTGFSLPDAARKVVLESPQEYVQRGERLVTLAKEHLRENICRKIPDTEAAIYDMSLDLNATRQSPREYLMKLRNVVGGYLRAVREDGDDACRAFYSLTGGRVSIKIREDMCHLKDLLGGGEEDVVIEVSVKKENAEPHTFFGLKNKPFGFTKKSHVKLYQKTLLVEDVRNVMAYCVLFNEIEKAFQDDALSKILTTEVREKYHDRTFVYRSISGLLCENAWQVLREIFKYEDGKHGVLLPVLRGEIQRFLESGHTLKMAVGEKAALSHRLAKNLERYGVTLCVWPEKGMSLRERSVMLLKGGLGDRLTDPETEMQMILSQMMIPMPDQLGDTDCRFIFWADDVLAGDLPGFNDTLITKSRFSGINKVEKEHFRTCFGRPGAWYWDDWMFKLFFVIFAHRHEALAQWREYKESVSEYAKSYMNKARLPQKTVQAMQASLLNDYFGFVEYDEDVDLEKAAEVEKMFLAVRETYLKKFDVSKNAVRFRKLGNHNATGLYYPGVRCLCVDYRHPSSFMHEFGHLIDYECGGLSIKDGFYHVKRLYREWLAKYEGCFNKKSKYNIQYYLMPTEIFARSFEIYCHKELKIKNDLLPDEFEKAVYPADEQYIREVTAYFNSLLDRKAA